MTLTPGQVTMLHDWVDAGGNLIAMRPDKQLAGLLGISDGAATLSNAYLKIDTGTAAGAGLVDQTIQFHGTADRYSLDGAASIATLFTEYVDRDSQPGRHPARRRPERRTGRLLHLRPGAFGRVHPPGQSGLGER